MASTPTGGHCIWTHTLGDMPRCTQDHSKPKKRTASDTMNIHTPFSKFFFWSYEEKI
jgi:hypothetical protein